MPNVPVFGQPPTEGNAVVRPSAYGLVVDNGERLAVVRTPNGLFLPGGGIEPGESPPDTVVREIREECGLRVQLGSWSVQAVDFVYSLEERRHFEKHSTFIDACWSGQSITGGEADHVLEWVSPRDAIIRLSHPSHRWAVAEWLGRGRSA